MIFRGKAVLLHPRWKSGPEDIKEIYEQEKSVVRDTGDESLHELDGDLAACEEVATAHTGERDGDQGAHATLRPDQREKAQTARSGASFRYEYYR